MVDLLEVEAPDEHDPVEADHAHEGGGERDGDLLGPEHVEGHHGVAPAALSGEEHCQRGYGQGERRFDRGSGKPAASSFDDGVGQGGQPDDGGDLSGPVEGDPVRAENSSVQVKRPSDTRR